MTLEFNNPIFPALGLLLIVISIIDIFISSSMLSLVGDALGIIAGLALIIRYFLTKKGAKK
ncbi:MAG: hypothetical protein Q7R70_05070 [Candidatus Diapherotrites archaeon]|nr:hypothetical protein [Candidatus Diapherotrites archaeon]